MDNIDKFRLISGDLNLWRDMYKIYVILIKYEVKDIYWMFYYLLNV